MLEDFLITIAKGLSMEPFTLLIMMLLCAIAAYMLAQMVPSPAMIMFGYPMLLLGALLTNWGFTAFRLQAVNDKYSNSVVATAVGLILTLGFIMVLTQVTTLFEPMPERDDIDEAAGGRRREAGPEA